jgi:hypothetical protein
VNGSWYYLADGVPTGPVTLTELQERFRAGHLRPLDLVGRDGMPHWQFAAQAQGLLPVPWVPGPPPAPLAQNGGTMSSLHISMPRGHSSLLDGAPMRPAGMRSLAGQTSAGPDELEDLWQRIQQLHDQKLFTEDQFELLAELLDRARSGGTARPARGGGRNKLGRLKQRSHRHAHQDDEPDAENEADEVLDAVACDVADDDEVFDAIDYGPDAFEEVDEDYEGTEEDQDVDDFMDENVDTDGEDDLGDMSDADDLDDVDDLAGMDDDVGGADYDTDSCDGGGDYGGDFGGFGGDD